jgi:cell division septal protein FtsQ
MEKEKKKVKRKLRINYKGILFLIILLVVLFFAIKGILNMRVKNIVVENAKYLTDNEIIDLSGISNYSKIISVDILKIKDNLIKTGYVEEANIKLSLSGKVTISVKESKPLFVNMITGNVVLANSKEVKNSNKYIGLPTLINYVTEDGVYKELIKGLNKIDDEIIRSISEIEYNPDIKNEVVYDEYRFLLRMNDGNDVYINTPNIRKLNEYLKIYEKIGNNGTLYLDSNSSNYIYEKGK